MTKLTIQQSNTEDNKPAVKHSVGQYYLCAEDNSVYILSQVDCNKVSLVCLREGNRYWDMVSVAIIYDIADSEWDRITSGTSFTLLSSVDVRWKL